MWFFQNAKKQEWTKNLVLGTALAARFILVGYAYIHDYFFKVDFTDVDYLVFSDAAHHVAQGRSPYERATYRYTPLLAWILIPNDHWKDFGKILFCVVDIIVGWMLFKMMEDSEYTTENSKNSTPSPKLATSDNSIKLVSVLWLANPLTTVISARGNADVLVCAAVLLTLYLLQKHKNSWFKSALVHGFAAVHLKIYPLIYLPSIFLHLSDFSKEKDTLRKVTSLILNFKGYFYAAVSFTSLACVIAFFYYIYGETFIDEFLLYHIRRTDTRHNFSPYFLPLYLAGNDAHLSKIVGFGAFIPQTLTIVYFAFKYHFDLPFCWFLTTFAFVTFNKVCTSQYFVWYIVFLPLICQRIQMSLREAVLLVLLWFGGQGLWLFFAYLFEFEGYNVFPFIWAASLVFLLINCYILRRVDQCYVELPEKAKTE